MFLTSLLALSLVVEPNGLSLYEARTRIRAARAAGDTSVAIVTVRGVNTLSQPFVLTPEDHDIRFVGEAGTAISGGLRLTGWKDEGDGVWSADLPRLAEPHGDREYEFFEQLWVNGRRAERARLPNRGYFKLKGASCAEAKLPARYGGRYFVEKFQLDDKDAELLAKMPTDELDSAQLCLICKWTFARRILRDYDAAAKTVETHSPTAFPHYAPWGKGNLVWFENVRSAFDAPGEWFYDQKAKKVKYRPLPGEDMAKAVVFAPRTGLSQLVVFAGDAEKGKYVKNVSFASISFECTASKTLLTDIVRGEMDGKYALPETGPTESWQYQAAQASDAAIGGEGVQNAEWRNCAVRHTANYAFRLQDGCQSNRIVSCVLEDLGAGGIWLGAKQSYVPPGEGSAITRRVYRTTGPKSNAHNLISNCVIRTAGRFNPEATGVAITHASDCKVTHCDISDIYYTGVSIGWVWGFGGSVAQRNEIAFNRIWDLGKGVMSDMGGVYSLGTSYGTTVHDNVIHDVKSYSYGGWGLYCDEGSEGIIEERNLVWNTTDGGFHQHYGAGCVIRNNIFAFNKMLGAVRMYRDVVQNVPCTLNFVNNIVYVNEGPLAGEGVRNVGGVWANNLWYDVRGRDMAQFDKLDWDAWVASGKESGGAYGDPLFADPQHFDFTLSAESPALKLGFKPFDYSRAGSSLNK